MISYFKLNNNSKAINSYKGQKKKRISNLFSTNYEVNTHKNKWIMIKFLKMLKILENFLVIKKQTI